MALHTALAFLILTLAILAADTKHGFALIAASDTAGGVTARWLLPIIPVALFFLGWIRLKGEQAGLYDFQFGLALMVLMSSVGCMTAVAWATNVLHNTDVTRKIAETKVLSLNAALELQRSEERFRMLVRGVKDYAIFMLDPKGNVISWNEGAERIKGYKADEIIGKNFAVFYTPEELATGKPAGELIQADVEGKFEEEGWRLRKDGSRFWANVLITPVRHENGELRGFSKVTRDDTERKNTEQRLKESEIRYRLLADNSIDMILLMRRDGTRLYASPACRTLLGYEPAEMLALSTRDAIHPEDFSMVFERLANGENELETLTYRMRRKDGSYVWVESVVKAIAEEPGRPLERLLVVRNIEQRVAAEQRVKDSEARYRLLADHSTDMVFQLDANLVRRYVSPACREILGYEPEELIGLEIRNMLHPDDADRVTQLMQSVLDGRADRQSIISRVRHRDQRWIWVEVSLRVLKDPKTGERIGIIGALGDISVRKAVEDKLAEATRRLEVLAREDGLTGLPNRRAFDDALSSEYRRARRNKKSLSLIMLDVDRFKSFNDRYGHPAGDECLRQISKAIQDAIFRPGDIAARYGGEEFVMLLPDTDEIGAALIGERVRQAVSLLSI